MEDGASILGEFWVPGDTERTTGTLRTLNGGGQLELVGCLSLDRLPDDATFVGSPREIPVNGGEHPIVCGLLRTGKAVTLVGVRGFAVGSMRITNGTAWEREGLADDATMWARYVVFDALEETEPHFERIDFTIPGLAWFLERSRSWRPIEPVSQLHGHVPIVVPEIPDYTFELRPGIHLSFIQVIQQAPATKIESIESSRFSLSSPDRPVALSDVIDDMAALRALSEFVAGRHQPVLEVVGRRPHNRPTYMERFPIHHPWQAEISPILREPYVSFGALFPVQRERSIDTLAESTAAQDPARAEFVKRWREWFAHSENAEAINAYLDVLHRDHVDDREVLKANVGVLEHLADHTAAPGELPRTAPPSEEELAARQAVIDWIESNCSDGLGAVDWSLQQLRQAQENKGLKRRLSELMDSIELVATPILRRDRSTPEGSTNAETPDTTARFLTKLRGRASHGTGQTQRSDLAWRVDQSRLLVLAIVLVELGVPAAQVSSVVLARSRIERWWDHHR